MARPWRIRYAGAKYHVTVRGNGRREIFHDSDDYRRFLLQLTDALEKDEVILYAYALLPNHFHLFVETPHGNVQRFMQRLNTAYSMFHRFKHAQPGHCLQGRYGAKLVSGDPYVMALTRYIHLNPVKTVAFASSNTQARIDALNAYPWSSYPGSVSAGRAEEIINYRWLALMGGVHDQVNRRRYRRYVETFVSDEDEVFLAAGTASRYAIGDERFVKQVESDLADARENKGVYGDILWPEGRRVSFDLVSEAVADVLGLDPDDLRGRSYAARIGKKMAIELCCLYSGESQRSVGAYFGYRGNGAAAKQRQSLRTMMQENERLAKTFKRLKKTLAKA